MAQIKKNTSLRKAILQAAITGQLISNVEGESLPLAPASKLSSATPSAGASPATPPETGKELLDKIIEERNNKLLADWEESLLIFSPRKSKVEFSNENSRSVGSSNDATSMSLARKNKKTKKPAPVVASEIDEEEIPFEIPENWCWCRFGEITINRDSERIPLSVSQRELLKKKYDYYGASGIIDKVDNYLFDKDLLLIGEDGANLLTRSTPIAFIASGKYWVNNHAHVIDCNSNYINLNYIKFFINAISLAKYVTGTAQPKMNQEKMNSIPVALPPLAVQNAIVAKLEQVLPLVDAYENALLQKEELKSALPDKVKKAILQEAITGQLTEAWRKSATIKESGKQLLDRIIEERNAKALAEWEESLLIFSPRKSKVDEFSNENSRVIGSSNDATSMSLARKNKKTKKPVPVVASEIEEDEIPFEVPESWCWCRLGDLVPFGQCENAEPNEIEDDAWILDLEDIEKDSGRILQFKTKKEVDSKSTKHIFNKGYVLYSKLRPYLNKCVIAPKDGYCTSEILPLDFGKLINNKFAQIFLMSPYFVDYTDSLSFGVKMPRLGTEDGKKALVPLPPLEEQEEIVKKVEELLPLCK